MKVLEEIPISIKNQHNLLNLLAEGYKSLSKALMEYVDNSFDSADDFFNSNGKYSRDVKINVVIDTELKMITIQDNCEGMSIDILKGLANSINDSEKRRREQKRPWVNGQFGLGAHAFRFFAQKLTVFTRQKNRGQIAILIDRDKPFAQRIELFHKGLENSGTLVEIAGIDKMHLKNLKADELKLEIETYFEMLLRRNVEVKIQNDNFKSMCIPLNYEKIEGLLIKKEITSWREGTSLTTIPEGKGIKVELKVCAHKIERPPFFSRKGRRINYIANMDSFMRKTQHRKKVWENYYLTGYIEVGDNLEPVLTKDDFLGGKGHALARSGIYEAIVEIEDDVHAAIEIINKDRSDESLKTLASALTDYLSEIAKEEEIRISYENKSGKDKSGEWIKVIPDPESTENYQVGKRRGKKGRPRKSKIIKASPDKDSDLFGRKIEGEKKGVRIEFSTLPAVDKRSVYGDGVITIFTNHPDFINRRTSNELEQTKITPRLANYLSAVISSEYKEVFYRQKKLEPSRKTILDEQIDFIFLFEQKMKNLINQPLDLIGSICN